MLYNMLYNMLCNMLYDMLERFAPALKAGYTDMGESQVSLKEKLTSEMQINPFFLNA